MSSRLTIMAPGADHGSTAQRCQPIDRSAHAADERTNYHAHRPRPTAPRGLQAQHGARGQYGPQAQPSASAPCGRRARRVYTWMRGAAGCGKRYHCSEIACAAEVGCGTAEPRTEQRLEPGRQDGGEPEPCNGQRGANFGQRLRTRHAGCCRTPGAKFHAPLSSVPPTIRRSSS